MRGLAWFNSGILLCDGGMYGWVGAAWWLTAGLIAGGLACAYWAWRGEW